MTKAVWSGRRQSNVHNKGMMGVRSCPEMSRNRLALGSPRITAFMLVHVLFTSGPTMNRVTLPYVKNRRHCVYVACSMVLKLADKAVGTGWLWHACVMPQSCMK